MPSILLTMRDAPLTTWIYLFRCVEGRFPGATIQKYDRSHLLVRFRQLLWHEQEDSAFFDRLAHNLLIAGWEKVEDSTLR